MEEYAGRILACRYRLPLPSADEYEPAETRAFDTRSGQEVLVRQVPLPEIVDAELLDGPEAPAAGRRPAGELPAVRRAIEAAQAAASVPDHPRLDQVFDVFAEDGSLWIVSELIPARPLAALIADEPMSPYRAAEVASDVLTALRVLHAHGWTHRNITVRTVLVCDDGRVVLTGLAAGAAEDALCGYDPVPADGPGGGAGVFGPGYAFDPGPEAGPLPGPFPGPGAESGTELVVRGQAGPEVAGHGAGHGFAEGPETRPQPWPGPATGAGDHGPQAGPGYAPLVAPGYDTGPRYTDHITPGRPEERPDLKAAARAGAIAAYRAGAQAAAARAAGERRAGADAGPEERPEGSTLPQGYSYPYGGPGAGAAAPWHGAAPRRPALPPPGQEPEPHPGPEPDAGPLPGGRSGQSWSGDEAPRPGSGQPWSEPQPGAPVRPVLPAQLALPQGYRQAETPAPGPLGGPPQPPEPGAAHPPVPARPLSSPSPSPQVPGRDRAEPAQASVAVPVPGGGAEGSGAGGWGTAPRSGLDAERARQTRMAVVGAVTERWAPEQAGPVQGNWQLAPPVGPTTDLWALGALLYRAVQGHAPYPEDSVAELVEMVCAEPPAFAEECGALRPVVESLLRQDPTERPDFEELRGWLRSLVRSAPEPESGHAVFPVVEPDPARLPVVRRRGELHGRHRNPEGPRTPRKPRSLGRALVVGVLAVLAGAVAYALVFMPRVATGPGEGARTAAQASPEPGGTGSAGPSAPAPSAPAGTPEPGPAPQTTATVPAAPAPPGYASRQDPEHFEIVVPEGWERRGINESGQVRYTEGPFTLTVVPGRDKVQGNPDPAAYQKDKEPELTPYRTSTWSTVTDVRTTKVGQQLRATGTYTWIDGTGRNVVARNYVVALGGSYHVVIVTGPQDEAGKVTEVFEKATASYRVGG
ncbi:serine/threonine protein kinase [Streptomyces sp. NPDC051567]|uniref:serine/threonine protein kinase n=1 Tax=Streptomyces sp. NPDC051567 TaxID=3365660 RepID=UPI0037A9622E